MNSIEMGIELTLQAAGLVINLESAIEELEPTGEYLSKLQHALANAERRLARRENKFDI